MGPFMLIRSSVSTLSARRHPLAHASTRPSRAKPANRYMICTSAFACLAGNEKRLSFLIGFRDRPRHHLNRRIKRKRRSQGSLFPPVPISAESATFAAFGKVGDDGETRVLS